MANKSCSTEPGKKCTTCVNLWPLIIPAGYLTALVPGYIEHTTSTIALGALSVLVIAFTFYKWIKK